MSERRSALRADCASCFALCCVVPAFSVSADFAIDKPAGRPCRNLLADFGCSIHERLRETGFPGCTVYDCFGAGQKVARETFGGRDWRSSPEVADRMFAVFPIMRELHQLLWYRTEALTLRPAATLHDDLAAALDETERLTHGGPDALVALDIGAHWRRIDPLLLRTSELVRAGTGGRRLRRADLVGKNFRRADLRGADLRGSYLIGADLRDADLRTADLIGADLRGADLRGADLGTSIFLTRPQVDAARGDGGTTLPPSLTRPAHWAA